MNYGEHNHLVNEVIDLIKHGELSAVVDTIWLDIKNNESGSVLGFILSDLI